MIYHEIKRYEAQRVENKSTYWVIFELIWRILQVLLREAGEQVFLPGGTVGKSVDWSRDEADLRAWKEGRTGIPRGRQHEGDASHRFHVQRGRQNVASFLALDLRQDWRLGDHFESLLLDYDVCSLGELVSAAGLTGGRINRQHLSVQGLRCGRILVRLWVPELRKVPTKYVHKPGDAQERAGVQRVRDWRGLPKPCDGQGLETYTKRRWGRKGGRRSPTGVTKTRRRRGGAAGGGGGKEGNFEMWLRRRARLCVTVVCVIFELDLRSKFLNPPGRILPRKILLADPLADPRDWTREHARRSADDAVDRAVQGEPPARDRPARAHNQ